MNHSSNQVWQLTLALTAAAESAAAAATVTSLSVFLAAAPASSDATMDLSPPGWPAAYICTTSTYICKLEIWGRTKKWGHPELQVRLSCMVHDCWFTKPLIINVVKCPPPKPLNVLLKFGLDFLKLRIIFPLILVLVCCLIWMENWKIKKNNNKNKI